MPSRLAFRGTSRGERVEDPVDAVLTLVTVGRQLFLSKEESCGVEEAAILCNAAGEREQQMLTGEGLQHSGTWRRMSASRGLVFTATGLRGKQRRRSLASFCHAARTRPDRRDRRHATKA